MPFQNPFKKNYKKLDKTQNTNQNLNATTVVEQDIVPIKNKHYFTTYKNILNLYLLDENSLVNYTNYSAEQVQSAKKHKKEIEAYFKKQKEFINYFIETIIEVDNYNKKLKIDTNKTNKLQLEKRITNLKNLISVCTYNFSKSRKEIEKNIGFKDTGPTLTQDGLVLYRT